MGFVILNMVLLYLVALPVAAAAALAVEWIVSGSNPFREITGAALFFVWGYGAYIAHFGPVFSLAHSLQLLLAPGIFAPSPVRRSMIAGVSLVALAALGYALIPGQRVAFLILVAPWFAAGMAVYGSVVGWLMRRHLRAPVPHTKTERGST